MGQPSVTVPGLRSPSVQSHAAAQNVVVIAEKPLQGANSRSVIAQLPSALEHAKAIGEVERRRGASAVHVEAPRLQA